MLSVGRQVGGNYRCIILYLVDRHCVPTVGDLRVITIVVASMSHRWGVCQFWCPRVSVGEKKCVVSGVSAECVTLCLSLVSNNGTCVWLAGVFRRSRGSCRVVCILQSFMLTLDVKELRLCASAVCVWVALLDTPLLIICQISIILFLFTINQ
jgi:hypothetical protein